MGELVNSLTALNDEDLMAKYEALNGQINDLHAELQIRLQTGGAKQIGQQVNDLLVEIGNVVAELRGYNLINIEKAAQMIRQDAWVQLKQFS